MVVSGLKWELVLSSYSMESLAFFFYDDHVHLASTSGFLNPAVHRLSAAGYQPSGKQNACSHLGCGHAAPGGFMRVADATEAADGRWSSRRSLFGMGRLFVGLAPGRSGGER